MQLKSVLLLSIMAMALLSAIACNQNSRDNRSVGDSVKNALEQADLKDVTVSDDADKNTVTLGGTLHSEDAKARAGDGGQVRRWRTHHCQRNQRATGRRRI